MSVVFQRTLGEGDARMISENIFIRHFIMKI